MYSNVRSRKYFSLMNYAFTKEILTACSSGLLSWVLSVAVALGAVVVVCLVTGRRNVAESVTCGFESDD